MQENPLAAPHNPSAVGAVAVEVGALEVALPVDEAVEDAVDAVGDEVGTLPLAARYQLASGSPMHSPMVTPR